MQMSDFLSTTELFLSASQMRGNHNGDKTTISYRSAYRKFAQWCHNNQAEWCGATLTRWQVSMSNDGKASSTIENRSVCLRSFCKWLSVYESTEDLSRFLPTIRTKKIREEEDENRRVITQEELDSLRIITHDLERDTIDTIALTGLRSQEFRGLLAADWQQDKNRLHIRKEIAKGRKERIVPVSPKLAEILRRNLRGEKFAHVQKFAAATTLHNLLHRSAAKARITEFGAHALRHYFGTAMIRANVNLVVVSRIMGHSTIEITARLYVHLEDSDLDGATNCL